MLSAFRAVRAQEGPTMFIVAFALWSICNGFALLVTDNAFAKSPIYLVMLALKLPEDPAGAAMIADGLALFWSIGNRDALIAAGVTFLTGLLWIAWATCMFLGGLQVGFISSSALWTIIVSIMLVRTVGGYAARPAAE